MPKSKPLLALCALLVTLLSGCSPADQPKNADGGARDRPGLSFDGDAAFRLLQRQVDLGPRVPGTAAHLAGASFIENELRKHAERVEVQSFTAEPAGKSLPMRNIIGWFNTKAARWVLLAAHWDTRPTADMEIDSVKKATPIPGANDGASGVAVLLELARMFGARDPNIGVAMVFFDGEDFGPGSDAMFLGSRYFAQNLASLRLNDRPVRFDYGILLDMVGDRNLQLFRERNSVDAAPNVVDKVWAIAKELGHEEFRKGIRYTVSDDHVPLIRAGVKCIDIIDFDYAPWHTLDDTPDKCSPRSLCIVGEVVATVIYAEE